MKSEWINALPKTLTVIRARFLIYRNECEGWRVESQPAAELLDRNEVPEREIPPSSISQQPQPEVDNGPVEPLLVDVYGLAAMLRT